MNPTNYDIIGVPKYESRGAASTALGTTQEGLVPMLHNDTPNDNSIPYGYCRCGCGEKTPVANRNYHDRGIKKGDPLSVIRGHAGRLGHGPRKPRPTPIVVDINTVAIPLVGERGLGKVALVSTEDMYKVSAYRWSLGADGYITSKSDVNRSRTIWMHRLILDDPVGFLVDHRNHNTSDNRRSNLRHCTPQENTWNTRGWALSSSRFKGVSWDKHREKWHASIRVLGRNKSLGRFDDEESAALAYDHEAMLQFGEFASLNFPDCSERGGGKP